MNRSLDLIHRQLQNAVDRLVDSDEWRAMLEVAARFHTTSVNTSTGVGRRPVRRRC